MTIRKPLATLALAGGAFGLSMGIGYAAASAATTGGTTNTNSSSSASPPATTPRPVCPNMGGAPGPSGSGPSGSSPSGSGGGTTTG
jgi:hypothetical protein